MHNDIQFFEKRGEQRSRPREEIRVEIETPIPNNNLAKNHPPEEIIGSRDKGVMKRKIVNEELFLISHVKPKRKDEACRVHYSGK